MGKYVADVRRIASIYPGKLDRIRMNHGPTQRPSDGATTWYELTPVAKNQQTAKQCCVIEIYDSFEHSKDELKSAAQGQFVPGLHPISADAIVRHLLLQWTGNLVDFPPGALPGIMEITHSVPTQDELQQMKDQQMAYMEFIFMEAEREARIDVRRIPTERARMAADYLGRHTAWSHPSETAGTAPCPACRQSIPEDAYVCHLCGTKIRAFPPELKQLEEQIPA